jgi:hypothetical protein
VGAQARTARLHGGAGAVAHGWRGVPGHGAGVGDPAMAAPAPSPSPGDGATSFSVRAGSAGIAPAVDKTNPVTRQIYLLS